MMDSRIRELLKPSYPRQLWETSDGRRFYVFDTAAEHEETLRIKRGVRNTMEAVRRAYASALDESK
jgi:hypothetical protein